MSQPGALNPVSLRITHRTRAELAFHRPFFSAPWSEQKGPTLGGLEPPTFRLTAERANRLRYGNFNEGNFHFRKVSATSSYLARIDKQNIGAVGYKLSWPMTPQLSSTKRGRLRALLSKPQLGLACWSSGMILA